MIEAKLPTENGVVGRQGILGCDVHPSQRGTYEIRSYMPIPWRDRYREGGQGFYGNPSHGARLDSLPPGEGPTGSDPDSIEDGLVVLHL